VIDPLFWLGLSILLVAVSLTAVLVAALPAFRELARAARSAEKLFDTLSRELPPTLEAIRLTGMEITDLKEDVSEGVQSAGRVVQQVDQSVSGARNQVQQVQKQTRSLLAGVKAAWISFNRPVTAAARHTEIRGATLSTPLADRPPSGNEKADYEETEDEIYISQNSTLSQNLDSDRPEPNFEQPRSSDRPSISAASRQKL
jgi:FtsZ-binding cell division protein ZapB